MIASLATESFVSQLNVVLRGGLLQLVVDGKDLLSDLLCRLGVLLDGDRDDIVRIYAFRQQRLRAVDLRAVVGQEAGDLLLGPLEAVDGQFDPHGSLPG